MPTDPTPHVGLDVLYVLPSGEDRPATVTRALPRELGDGRVNLRWLADCDADGPDGTQWAASVRYDANGRPGTWRVRA